MRLTPATLIAACLFSCGPSTPISSPSPPPVPASVQQLSPYYGSYTDGSGDVVVIARPGWFFDIKTAAYRTIYATRGPDHFTIGPRFLESTPKFADLSFAAQTLTIRGPGQARTAHRIAYKETEVTIPAQGARLAGAITEPLGAAPHPGIVIVHGAERGERYFYDVWVGVYASLGFAVLTYDKRGVGSSTGNYPGEFPTAEALNVYADDAAAARDFLARWPGVDPSRTGFHGGSQGGWTVPLAITRHGGGAFAVLASAPATTVDQTDLWASFTGGGASAPTESNDQMLADVRRSSGGYDPMAALRAMTVPAIWVLGTNDRTVPTAVCVELLNAMRKPNFTVHLVPTGHGLLVNPTGLLADDASSPGLAPDLVPTLKEWFASEVKAA
ncbi:MAG TPA: prolyl oligopeptidase family serine peptidase [Candidatus Acidoferrum sp.]|nr:prolyl oligopeptidase family serine peptidase [Candidatus Acidoferrum sp.]